MPDQDWAVMPGWKWTRDRARVDTLVGRCRSDQRLNVLEGTTGFRRRYKPEQRSRGRRVKRELDPKLAPPISKLTISEGEEVVAIVFELSGGPIMLYQDSKVDSRPSGPPSRR